MRSMLSLAALSSILMLSACGAGGGDEAGDVGGTHPENPSPPSAVSVNLGSRVVPGFNVQAVRMSPVVAGQPVAIRLTVTPLADQPLPLSVESWAAGDSDTTTDPTTATAVVDQPGVYDAFIPLADPLPATCAIWTRLQLSDGSILELGRDDFVLGATP